jgi:hypothetical protein
VEAIVQVQVSETGRTEKHGGAGSESAVGMSGRIVRGKVGFHFDELVGHSIVDQNFAEEIPGDFRCRTRKEATI